MELSLTATTRAPPEKGPGVRVESPCRGSIKASTTTINSQQVIRTSSFITSYVGCKAEGVCEQLYEDNLPKTQSSIEPPSVGQISCSTASLRRKRRTFCPSETEYIKLVRKTGACAECRFRKCKVLVQCSGISNRSDHLSAHMLPTHLMVHSRDGRPTPGQKMQHPVIQPTAVMGVNFPPVWKNPQCILPPILHG